MTMDFYNPKPAPFKAGAEALACLGEATASHSSISLVRSIINGVAFQLLRSKHGMRLNDNYWRQKESPNPLQSDPWCINYRQNEFGSYAYDKGPMTRYQKAMELCRKRGFWTCHNGQTGKQVPFPVKEGHVRINPEAWETLLAHVTRAKGHDLRAEGDCNVQHPGWYTLSIDSRSHGRAAIA